MPSRLVIGSAENALAAVQIGSNGGLQASVSFDVDGGLGDRLLLQIESLGGASVAATSGCRVRAYRLIGKVAEADTVATVDVALPTVATTNTRRTFELPGGPWRVSLENLDTTVAAANAITVSASLALIEQSC